MFIPLFDIDEEYGYQTRKISELFTPVMTTIILICVLVFIYQTFLEEDINKFYQQWGTTAYKILNANQIGLPAYLSLITYAFVHGGFWHILGNLWFLFIFGNNVERKMGIFVFLVFYLSAAVVAALVHTIINFPNEFLYGKASNLAKLQELHIPLVGASGAISAVLGAYLKYFPRNYVATLVLFIIISVIPVSASIFIGVWLLGQIINALLSPQSSIAWFAHIGGFLYGYLFASIYKGKTRNYYY